MPCNRLIQSDRRFGRALQGVVRNREDFLTSTGNVNWTAVAARLDGVSYETLRKAVAGERPPSPELISTVAAAFELPPKFFLETQLAEAQLQFDPRHVGWKVAAENVEIWQRATGVHEGSVPMPSAKQRCA